jgi:hypothetical protein
LRGEFQGADTILLEGVKDDNDKVVRLIFRGITGKEAEVVGAAGATGGSEGGEAPSANPESA